MLLKTIDNTLLTKNMDNTYYIMSKNEITIERFHICTWEILKGSAYIEFGAEINEESFTENSIELFLAAPFVEKSSTVEDLCPNLCNDNNSRFIFNDVVTKHEDINNENSHRSGSILTFNDRGTLIILPCTPKTENRYIKIELKKPSLTLDQKQNSSSENKKTNYYFRILVKTDRTIAEKNGRRISRKNFIYDFKINKTRNIPDDVFELKNNENLKFCNISKMFCFHVIPDYFELSFINSKGLEGIRKLETNYFKKYLPELKQVKTNHNNIVFLKETDKTDGYSFFTVCTDENIGIRQVALAVGANVLISLLFGISAFRNNPNINKEISWIKQLPVEYYLAAGLIVVMVIVIMRGDKIVSYFENSMSWLKKIGKR